MNPDLALQALRAGGEPPREALQWSLEHWDTAAPRFLAKLRAAAGGGRLDEPDLDALFFIIHLCGEKQESRAYAPLCQIVAERPELCKSFGDALLETFSGILIAVYDGDPEPLRRAFESDGNEFARAAAMEALSYLVRLEAAIPEAEMARYLEALPATLKARDKGPVWEAWAMAIGRLGLESLRGAVARAYAQGRLDRAEFPIEDVYADLAAARRDADGLGAFRDGGVGPFDSVLETFDAWEAADADEDGEFAAPVGAPGDAPFVNPFREVGRNDPCPCGSGKKYKKCCLAA